MSPFIRVGPSQDTRSFAPEKGGTFQCSCYFIGHVKFQSCRFFMSLSFLLLRHSLACQRDFDLSGMARPGEALCGHLEGSMVTFKTPSRPSLDFCDEDRFFFVDMHWIVNRIRIVRGWPVPGQLCVVSHNGYWNSLKNSFL